LFLNNQETNQETNQAGAGKDGDNTLETVLMMTPASESDRIQQQPWVEKLMCIH